MMFDSTAIVNEAIDAGLNHVDDAQVIPFLRNRGLSIVQSAIVYAKLRGVSLADAKEVMMESETWSSDLIQNVEFHDSLERAVADETLRDQ